MERIKRMETEVAQLKIQAQRAQERKASAAARKRERYTSQSTLSSWDGKTMTVLAADQQEAAPQPEGVCVIEIPESYEVVEVPPYKAKPEPKQRPRSNTGVAKAAKQEETSGGFTTRSFSMGALPCDTSPLKRGSVKGSSTKLESIGEELSTVDGAIPGPVAEQVTSTPATAVSKPKQLKNRHGYRSVQTDLMKNVAEGAEGAIDDAMDKAVFRDGVIKVKGMKRMTMCERQEARNRKAFVSEDLYWFLRIEFLFEPRTKDVLKRMKMKAKQFMSNHDMNGFSLEYQFVLLVDTIRMVMEVHPKEEELRQGLKSVDGAELRKKQAALYNEGAAGASGWLGRFTLPATKTS